jgi:hypothetical protein
VNKTINQFSFAIISSIVFVIYWFSLLTKAGFQSFDIVLGILLMGILVNFFSKKLEIIGGKSSLPLLFTVLFLSILPEKLIIIDLLYAAILLILFYVIFSSSTKNKNYSQSIIHIGLLAGFFQLFFSWAFISTIILLIIGVRRTSFNPRQYLLFGIYFTMVIFTYYLTIFVLEIDFGSVKFFPKITYTFPNVLKVEYSAVILLVLLGYIPNLSRFPFRYPVQYKTFHTSLIFCVLGIFGLYMLGGENIFEYFYLSVFAMFVSTFFYHFLKKKFIKILFFCFVMVLIGFQYLSYLYHYLQNLWL